MRIFYILEYVGKLKKVVKFLKIRNILIHNGKGDRLLF